MLDTEEKVATKTIEAKSNPKQHIVAQPQYQMERNMSRKEEECELVDFRLRRESMPWKEVRSTKRKTASAPIMAKNAIKVHFDDTTKQLTEEKVFNVTRVRFNVPQNNKKM